MFEVLAKYIPSKPWENKNFSKVQFLRDPTVKSFVDDHVKLNKYLMQRKKCNNASCKFHKQPRADDFSEVKWMPSPTLTVNGITNSIEEYKTYEDTIGDDPFDDGCPSTTKEPPKIVLPKPQGWAINKSNARRVVSCVLCTKRRVLYSKKDLNEAELQQLDAALEETAFACGQLLVPETHL